MFYFIYFILLSLVIFINEDFDSSILEVFFDTFFITCFIFFFADFIIVGFKFFINRISLSLSNFILLLLPFLEIFSGLIKSFILSVRINTNYLSGHLLISIFFLVINFLLFSYYFSNIFFFALFLSFLYFLEVLVSFLQVYVLFILVLINVQDNNF